MTATLEHEPKIIGLSAEIERELMGMSKDSKRQLLHRLINEIIVPDLTKSMSDEERAEILQNAFKDEPGDFSLEEAMDIIPKQAAEAIANGRP